MGIQNQETAFSILKNFIRTDKHPLSNYECWASSRDDEYRF